MGKELTSQFFPSGKELTSQFFPGEKTGRPILSPGKKLTGEKTDRHTGVGAYEPLGSNLFQNHKYSALLPISCKTFTLNDILKVFPIQMHWRPMLTLPKVIIYIHIVDLESLMLHAKFQDPRPLGSLKVFTIYGHGGHLGHVTWIIHIYIGSPFL